MGIKEIKKKMTAYKDFYGGELLGISDIESATTKEELNEIIEQHRSHMEAMLSDAMSSLDNFKRSIDLYIL